MKQIENAITIAEIKYPKSEGYRWYWVFDHSSCHAAYAEDALIASHMNAKPGGAQPVMHDTVNNGRIQRMAFLYGTPKGLYQVLRERGVDIRQMKLEDLQAEMDLQADFRKEKTLVETFINARDHGCIMLPKFH